MTEREVRRGVIDAKDTDKHCLAYVRNIRNMDLTAANSIRNFVDMTGQEVDSEAEHLLSVLRDDVLPSRLAETNVARFTVDWSGDQGLDVQTHAEYLRQFCEVFDRYTCTDLRLL